MVKRFATSQRAPLCLAAFICEMDAINYEVRIFKLSTSPPPFFPRICNMPREVLPCEADECAKVTDAEAVLGIYKVVSSQRVWPSKSIADSESISGVNGCTA